MLLFLFIEAAYCQWTWTNEANLDNEKRWSKNMTKPCGGQVVSFSSELPTSVMIRESFSIGVLNLPNYGEIILSDNLIIGVDPAISGCSDTEPVQWSSIPDSWFEPANWKNSDLRNSEFTRDEESVPCQNSRVILPQETTFMISSESSLLAETTSIQPWGSALTSSSTLAQYKATDWGRYQIPQLEVDFAQQFCDSTGCLCHKSQYQSSLMATICASKTCPELECQDGFIPSGHCCPICGAQIHLDYNNDFNFDQFEKFVDEQVNGDLNIKYKAYKGAKNTLTRGEVELEILVVLTDSDDTDSYAKTEAKKLSKAVKSFPGVVDYTVDYSGKGPGMTGGAVFGIICAVLLIPLVLGFVYIKRDSLPTFSIISSFSNQNYTPRAPPPTQDVPLQTDFGAFALSGARVESADSSSLGSETVETSETMLPPRKKKKAPVPPARPRIENQNYESTNPIDTVDHGVPNQLYQDDEDDL